MKKTLFVIAALLTAACSSNREQEPTVVYRGYDDAGCNYYNGVCHRAAKKYIVETADGEVQTVNYRPTTTVVKTGEYKHCSDTIFGDPVPAPKYVASGPKVVAEQPQPVQVRRHPVRPSDSGRPVCSAAFRPIRSACYRAACRCSAALQRLPADRYADARTGRSSVQEDDNQNRL